ncbi:RNA polymerase sigma-70 factor, ECF subfamily [Amycolatopsis xylanica]|uniref:RNA polymerase sigma-70 factor, ECF subfamily n=1 Tax=Amycolatopsis xylanica TaxID=589385 RepID=A0A1H3D9F0_9PSEU|nr:RNA polymerase sigma factor [Amycolatopsis xylanica]SDX63031.1 RNA polymerase sigma-70 factor, ECF subfamily [Amycolatopsis xylanica]
MTAVSDALTSAFQEEWGQLVATLIGWAGDWDLAEECAQEAFARALRTWPRDGVPDRPGAWLLTTARRLAIDRLRRATLGEAKLRQLAVTEEPFAADQDESGIGDERLRLIFTCCHPALAFEARVSLALRTLTGLSTAEVARAFGVPEATMAKRLARAKQKIRDAGIPYRIPPAHLLPHRTHAVLAVIYLVFNEGYVATSGADLLRPDLAHEAIRLAALVAELVPDDPEARGLHALTLLQHARAATRVSPDGALVPLEEQDRAQWDQSMIAAGLTELRHAARHENVGPYQLQAMIAACHAIAPTAADTDWARITLLYDALSAQVPSPTVALNRAIAVAMSSGPDAGLALLDDLGRRDHLLHAARADLLRRAGRSAPAAEAYRTALAHTSNEAERGYLRRRLGELEAGG